MSALEAIRQAFGTSSQFVGDITPGEVFEILSNQRRRYIILELASLNGGFIRISDLARAIAEREHGRNCTIRQREQVCEAIKHTHSDQLYDAQIASVMVDTVYVGENASAFADIIDHVAQELDP